MKIKNSLKVLKYRLDLRKAFQKSSIEELHICLEELKREMDRRNRK